MADSLKDQLLALGLAPKKAAKKPAKQVRAKAQKSPSSKPGKSKGPSDISLDQAYRIRSRQERQEKEKSIAQKREKERQRREINGRIKKIVNQHGVRDPDADCKRNFIFKGRIRSVLATREQIADINSGELGVVYVSGHYHLLPMDKTHEVREFAADHVPDLTGSGNEDEEDHPVPDDLIW